MTTPTARTFKSQRLNMNYFDWGNTDAPPLILLHGARDHGRSWDWAARELCKDWRVIVPEMRGHGDSDWSPDGDYGMLALVYDFSELIDHLDLAPVTIIAHSLGGNVALRYTGIYPENVSKIVAIEGLGPSPDMLKKLTSRPIDQRVSDWIDMRRQAKTRNHKRYESIHAATIRMRDAHPALSQEQSAHLTKYGVRKNDDESYSWKYDTYLHMFSPVDIPRESIPDLWARITCPVFLCYGKDSWASNPEVDGRLAPFKTASLKMYENAGHWLHHDQFEEFIADVKAFL